MMAISLWQPWASAIERGAKRIETRGWATPYRGPLAIQASLRAPKDEMILYGIMKTWQAALDLPLSDLRESLEFGKVLCVCDLTDCRRVEEFDPEMLDMARYRGGRPGFWTERLMGNYDAGRYGWVLENVRRLRVPVSFSGSQRFFNVPDELVVDLLEVDTSLAAVSKQVDLFNWKEKS